jgi:hypothetical protein
MYCFLNTFGITTNGPATDDADYADDEFELRISMTRKKKTLSSAPVDNTRRVLFEQAIDVSGIELVNSGVEQTITIGYHQLGSGPPQHKNLKT